MPAKTRAKAKAKAAVLFTCPYCGKRLKSKNGYNGHIRLKHPEKAATQNEKEEEQQVAQNDGNSSVDAPQVPPHASSPVPAQVPQASPQPPAQILQPPPQAPPVPLQAPQVDVPAIVEALSDGFQKVYAIRPGAPPEEPVKYIDVPAPSLPNNTKILDALAENTAATKQVCVGLECLKDAVASALEKRQEQREQAPAPVLAAPVPAQLPAAEEVQSSAQESVQALQPPPPSAGNVAVEPSAIPPPERPKKASVDTILDHIIHCPDCVKVLKRETAMHFNEIFPNHVLRSKGLETPQEIPQETQQETQNQTQEAPQDGEKSHIKEGPPEESQPEQSAETQAGPPEEDRTEGEQPAERSAEATEGPTKEEPAPKSATVPTASAKSDSAKPTVLTCPPYCDVRGI